MQEVVTCSGPVAIEFGIPPNRWSDADAAGKSPQELLLYRSNLLGGDQRVTNFGGGNTSAKIQEQDPLTGETVSVLWVKGSGGDIGSMGLDGFATLYLNEVLSTERLYRGKEFEDEMVGYLPHCAFNLNARAASIDTPLHAFLPHAHVDHVHPDAVIALAACKRGEEITEEVWGGEVGWLPWIRPGFELGFRLRDYATLNPDARGVVLAGHGIICWGDNARSCYENTIDLTAEAARYLNARLTGRSAFGGPVVAPLDHEARAAAAAKLMPKLRAFMGGEVRKVGHFLDGPEVLEFAGSRDFLRLSGLGTSCPDHFLRTKIKPLALNELKLDDDEYLRETLEEYRESYTAYYERCAQLGDPRMRDPNPIVFLIPGVGLITFAAEKAEARLASEFYCNAINVMRGAEAVGGYVGLPEQEAFKVEYWALEEAKLQRLPEPKPLAGKVAVVSGGAGGIGSATARRLLSQGACVLLLDLAEDPLREKDAELRSEFGADVVRSTLCDVTDDDQVQKAFQVVAREFGGCDIVIANAGLACSASIEETTRELWMKNYDVLAMGYFLTAREGLKLMKLQKGGSIIFIGSKNGLAAATNAAAYSSAKAAALHLARCLALECAPLGIRVNTVNPDAVLRGSRIWDGDWRQERAEVHGIGSGEELEAHYRNRSLLKLDVLPEDVAEAAYFFASDASAKSTGNILNVDAGNAQAFTR